MRFKRAVTRKVTANVDLAPLIDVVFQLIIFFMVTSSFVVQSSIPIEIPQTQAAPEQLEKSDLTLSLDITPGGPDDGGKIYISRSGVGSEREIATWDELTQVLTEFHQEASQMPREQQPIVLVRAHRDLLTQRLMDVLSLANSVGIENYGIQAESPTGGQ